MEFIFVSSKGRKVEFSKDSVYRIKQYKGIEGFKNTISSTKGYNQDGENYKSKRLDSRIIELDGYIVANTIQVSEELLNNLYSSLNIKETGTLFIKKNMTIKKIDCEVESLDCPYQNGVKFKPFLLDLYCPNPFFTSEEEISKGIAVWEGAFKFPRIFNNTVMGTKLSNKITSVKNTGHVKTGMKIIFRTIGSVTNPKIYNYITGEFIQLNLTMNAGDTITVDTQQGNKSVVLKTTSGVETSIFNKKTYDSTFLQLDIGENLFGYSASSNVDLLEIYLNYTNKYLGV